MTELYPVIRWTHIGLVLTSGTLFAARGLGVLLGAQWGMTLGVRRLSYTVDTALLSAALLLLYILDLNPFAVPWLSTKIALLLAYIVLGTFALKRARTERMRLVFYIASLLCFAFMLTVARAHHPLGLWA
ncbi:MAG: SirB2 family protein [Burkholderiales bacterium]|nr:SirB2 family protein [Burkholderiales bacterium]